MARSMRCPNWLVRGFGAAVMRCALCLVLGLALWPRWAQAAPRATTPTIDAVIGAGEYGAHVNGQNQQTSGGTTAYVTWDATNLYIAYVGANIGEAVVVYVDTNPVVPANGGSNANGNVTGFNYDNTNFAALPFRADFVTYFKNLYREYRTANGSGGWSGATSGFGSYADDGGNTREFALPWSVLGGQPAAFNFFAYATSSGGFVYGQVPASNASGFIGTSANYANYYLVASTAAPSLPFAAPSVAGSCYATPDNGTTVFNSANANAVRAAVLASSTGGTVKVAGTCAGAVAQGGSTQVALITQTLTLAGGYTPMDWNVSNPWANPTTLDAVGGGRVISTTPAATGTTLQGFSVMNGMVANGAGAGIYAAEALTLTQMRVSNNVVNVGVGGGVAFAGAATITNTVFENNAASAGGGAYFGGTAAKQVANTLFAGNSAPQGAAAYVAGAQALHMRHTTMAHPTMDNGTALYVVSGTVYLTNTLVASYTIGLENVGGGVTEAYSLFSNVATPYSGTVISAGGSITGAAAFYDTTAYTLTTSSAAVNTGTNAGVNSDYFGDPRPQGGGFEIGYDEAPYLATYTITPNAGPNGSITPATPQLVNYGDTLTFTITPDVGYHIVGVWADGMAQGPVSSFTFSNVAANHTLTASFALNTYNITPTAGVGGSIIPGTPQLVNHGDTLTFTIAPNVGYSILDVGVDGVSVGPLASYAFTNVTANHTLTASFAIDPTFFACYATHDNGLSVFGSQNAQAVRDAVGAAAPNGSVKVAGTCAGVVVQGGSTQVALITKTLALQGGYTATNWTTSSGLPSTLDAQGGGRVLSITVAATVQGFTVTNGVANAVGALGGGVFANNALTLSNMAVYSNVVTGASGNRHGGGVYIAGVANITGSTFISNSAASNGGGAYFNNTAFVTGTTFMRNLSAQGGGAFFNGVAVWVRNGNFTANTATDSGGGLRTGFSTSALVTNTLFFSNTGLVNQGGALFGGNLSLTGSVVLSNVTPGIAGGLQVGGFGFITNTQIIGNRAGQGGGLAVTAFSPLTVFNSLFARNWAPTNGAAIYQNSGPAFSLVHVTIVSPTVANAPALFVNSGTQAFLTNTIIASHTVGVQRQGTTGISGLESVNLFGVTTPTLGAGFALNRIVSTDPGFVNPAADDYHLGAASGCTVDTALNMGVGFDFEGDTRPQGSGIDLGYDESNLTNTQMCLLSVVNDSPTALGNPTVFTATAMGAGPLTYTWDFGDGALGSGVIPTHTYPAVGVYTAMVTATNGINFLTQTTVVNIQSPVCFATPDDGGTVFFNLDGRAVRAALGVAITNTTVKVAGYCAGVALQNSTTQVALITRTLTLAGGYTTTDWLTFNPMANPTVLDAQGRGRVVYANVTATVRGFTITNGLMDTQNGGGLFANAGITLSHMTFYSNAVINSGPSGIPFGGGAVANGLAHVSDSVFFSNTGRTGGGMAFNGLTWITNTAFIRNLTILNGGGASFVGVGNISGTVFMSNTTSQRGGGVYFSGSGANAFITNTRFVGNVVSSVVNSLGGGAYLETNNLNSSQVVNSLFARNSTAPNGNGAALYVNFSNGLHLVHNTIVSPTLVGNAAVFVTAGNVFVTNTVVASHTQGLLNNGNANTWNTLWFGNTANTLGPVGQTSSIYQNPDFVDPAADDYHLASATGCAVDTGWPWGLGFDFEGDARPQGVAPDIGFDETPFTSTQMCGISASNNGPSLPNTPTAFTAAATGAGTITYTWDFGDGGVGSGPTPVYTYTLVGTYTATVTATNGVNTLTATTIVVIDEARCFATPNDGGQVFTSADARALRFALGAAAPNATVKVAGYCAGTAVQNATAQVALITQTLTLAGGYTTTDWLTYNPAANPTTLDALGNGRVLYISTTATVQGLTVTNGFLASSANVNGGGIFAVDALTLTQVIVHNNVITTLPGQGGTQNGGGVYVTNAALVTNTVFSRNQARANGGGAMFNSIAALHSVTFTDNLVGNTFSGGGGGYFGSVAQVTNTVFANNQSQVNGGGAYFAGGGGITDTLFMNNRATTAGGGGMFFGSAVFLNRVTFAYNLAPTGGGASFSALASHVLHTTFLSNTATTLAGGALVNTGNLTNTRFIGNSAPSGGGLAFTGSGNRLLVNVLFARNQVTNTGAAVFGDTFGSGTLRLIHNTIVGPSGAAAAVAVANGTTFITNTIIASHTVGLQNVNNQPLTTWNLQTYGNLTNTIGAATHNNLIMADPGFVNPAVDDYRLTVASACSVDTGVSVGVPFDFEGEVRPQGLGFDIGFDESPYTNTQICALNVSNDSPTLLNTPTNFRTSAGGGGVLTFTWDFGDGLGMGSGPTPAYTYTVVGTYTATVTVTNGFNTLTATTPVVIGNAQCFATANDGGTVFGNIDARAVRAAVTAAPTGGTVKIAGHCPGVVFQSGLEQVLLITRTLTLAGGYTTTDWLTYNPVSNVTRLDGQGLGRVVSLTVAGTLRGLTIQNGYAAAGGVQGGGLYAANAVTLTDMLFTNNVIQPGASSFPIRGGGGAYVGGFALVTNTVFYSNSASQGGGAYFNGSAILTATLFNANSVSATASTALGGGALFASPAQVSRSTFTGNRATTGGGAYAGNFFYLEDSLFNANTADTGGGMAYGGEPFVYDTIFRANTATRGGALAVVRNANEDDGLWVNVLLDANTAPTGTAMYISSILNNNFHHLTVVSPTVASGPAFYVASGNVFLKNTIVASHTLGLENVGGLVVQGGSLFYGVGTAFSGTFTNTTVITESPAFYDTTWYTLTATSAAINAGPDVGVATDYFGTPRPQAGGFDLGYAESPFNTPPTITPMAGAGGTLLPATPQRVAYGSDLTFTVVPDVGYHILDVAVDGVSFGALSSYAFTNITVNHTITALFAINTYTITPIAGTGGSITPGTPQTLNHGDSVTFTIAPDMGYHIVDVGVDGVSVGVVSSYVFTNVTADHAITAAFAINTYTITPSAGANGSITPSTPQTVNYGDSVTFTIAPDMGYHIVDVGVDGVSVGVVSSYVFTNVMADHTITASFAINTYTITPIAGTGGTITPGTPQTLNHGDSVTFTIAPDMGYHIVDVGVDGVSVGVVSSYVFTNVVADHTITASFAINTYTITPSAGANGSITPSTPQTVNYGDSVTFTIAPDMGYHIVDVGVDGVSVGVVSSYAFTNVTANHTITALFAINTYTITPSAGANGGITPSTPQTVNHGSSITFTITPNTGYSIAGVWVDGASVGVVSSYAFTNVTANHTITAAFTINTYTITPNAGANGSITPATPQTVNHGASITFTITPNTGYSIAGVWVDGVSVGVVSSYAFTNVTANHTITAAFAINTYTITPSAGANGSITPSTPQTVNHGASITFTITPNTGYSIAGVWVDGVAQGTITSYAFTNVTANHTLTAAFTINTYTLTVAITGTGTGLVTPTVGVYTYTYGTVVTLTATANTGSTFAGWAGDCSGTGSCVVTMTANRSVTADFMLVWYKRYLPLVVK